MAQPRFTDVYLYTATAWVFSIISVGTSETCSYVTYGYNFLDNRNEQYVSFKECSWGCCWKFSDPCCSTPIGLIVGSVLGGLIIVVALALVVCCCCASRRRPAHQGAVVGYPGRQAGSGPGINIISSSHTTPQPSDLSMGSLNASTTSLPPGSVFEAPPSYDEVMSGQFNYAFKSETDPQ